MPGAASNTEKCLKKAKDRSCYDKPFPTICGSTSHHAAHNLCPRPGANRLITVAERKRFQSFPDHACLEVSIKACSKCRAPLARQRSQGMVCQGA